MGSAGLYARGLPFAAGSVGNSLLVRSFHDLVVSIEAIHGKPGLFGVVGVGTVIAAAITPPPQAAIVEVGFSRIMHGAAFGESRMAISGMQQRFSTAHADENVSRIGNVMTVMAGTVQPILIEERIQVENLIAVHRNGCGRIQVRVGFRLPRHDALFLESGESIAIAIPMAQIG